MNVYIVACARTPIGSYKGSLSSLQATDLGALAISEAIKRAGISKEEVTDCYMGHVITAGCGQSTARQAALKAGLSLKTCCTTVNKVCSSGIKSICLGVQAIKLNEADIVIAGGMESMSNAPFLMKRKEPTYGGFNHQDAIVVDGLTDAQSGLSMGECTEAVAAKLGLTREQQDEFAITSYQKSALSWNKEKGRILAKEVFEIKVDLGKAGEKLINEDEEYSRVDFDKLKTLRTVFKKQNGTITAGNASTLSDGAAVCVLMSQKQVLKKCIKPLARVVSYADAAGKPEDFSIIPSLAMQKALDKAGLEFKDIDLFEINEAFSVAVLGNIKICDLPSEKVNVYGGAISLGHPLAMSGTRIVNSLALQLKTGQYGLATTCNGGGGASAIIIQAV